MKQILFLLSIALLLSCNASKKMISTTESSKDSSLNVSSINTGVKKADSSGNSTNITSASKSSESGYKKTTTTKEYFSNEFGFESEDTTTHQAEDTAKQKLKAPVNGTVYFDKELKKYRIYNNGIWVDYFPNSGNQGRLLYRETTTEETGQANTKEDNFQQSDQNSNTKNLDINAAATKHDVKVSSNSNSDQSNSTKIKLLPGWVIGLLILGIGGLIYYFIKRKS